MSASAPVRRSRRAVPLRLTGEVEREHPMQRSLARVLTMEIARAGKLSRHGVLWFALDLASYSGEMPYTHIQRGCVPGLSDVWILWRGLVFVIELKAEDGELGEHQREHCAALTMAGGRYAVCAGVDNALRTIDTWQIPRKHMIEPQVAA